MGILSEFSKDEPIHDGEVFGVWSYMISNNGLLSIYSRQSFCHVVVPQRSTHTSEFEVNEYRSIADKG